MLLVTALVRPLSALVGLMLPQAARFGADTGPDKAAKNLCCE
jgi:hypothetical protein